MAKAKDSGVYTKAISDIGIDSLWIGLRNDTRFQMIAAEVDNGLEMQRERVKSPPSDILVTP